MPGNNNNWCSCCVVLYRAMCQRPVMIMKRKNKSVHQFSRQTVVLCAKHSEQQTWIHRSNMFTASCLTCCLDIKGTFFKNWTNELGAERHRLVKEVRKNLKINEHIVGFRHAFLEMLICVTEQQCVSISSLSSLSSTSVKQTRFHREGQHELNEPGCHSLLPTRPLQSLPVTKPCV